VIAILQSRKSARQLHKSRRLQAVESTIENAKKALIHDHITHCVNRSLKEAGLAGRAAMRDAHSVAFEEHRDATLAPTETTTCEPPLCTFWQMQSFPCW
jgi:uncharacterized protein